MPIDVKVRAPQLTIIQDRTFMVTDERGEMDPENEQGLFGGDTRFLCYYRLFINQHPWRLIDSALVSQHAARFHFLSPPVTTEFGDVADGEVSLSVTRSVADGIHEDLDITNYSLNPVRFQFEIALRSDFADIFEVREHRRVRRGRIRSRWVAARRELLSAYVNGEFRRQLSYRIDQASSPPSYANGRVVFDIRLGPGESWHACAAYVLMDGERSLEPLYGCYAVTGGTTYRDQLQVQWRAEATSVKSDIVDVDRAFHQAVEDIGALRLYDEDFQPDVWVAAAGAPWFVALFGRDSLVVALQTLMIHPGLALGALQKLAEYQAKEFDDWRDAEPGKIPHELRSGELAHFHRIPHTPYYGTADATILYLIALHEAWKWIGDPALLRVHLPVALRCLEWIDRYGDLDGDGFQEYRTRSSLGYENMGWKDSGDAVVYPDGRQVKSPKALCELQGYVFDAKLRMAEVLEALGESAHAVKLRAEAAELQRRFEGAFWSDSIGCYVFGLDSEKRPIETIASNAGHCLWSGIASEERAQRVAQRFSQPDMWTGWGIRTLSAENPAFNPFSYQRGSVWPHDNGIIALGFKRYGLANEVNHLARDLFAAARCHQSYRLPELYAGLSRQAASMPVPYVGANLPQAWAAGSIFHLVQAMLGLRADAPNERLCVAPALPDWASELELRGLRIGEGRVWLRFWRESADTRWEVTRQEGTLTVVEEPWSPWKVTGDRFQVTGTG